MKTTKSNTNQTLEELVSENELEINDIISNNIEIPAEHQKIVLDRMDKANRNPERLLDWDDISKNL